MDRFPMSELRDAAYAGDLFKVIEIMSRSGGPTDEQISEAMNCAAQEGKSDVVNYLFKCGADPAFRDRYGNTSFQWSVRCGDIDMVKLLFRKELVNVPNFPGRSPLYYAVHRGSPDITRFLLESGCDPNAKIPLPEEKIVIYMVSEDTDNLLCLAIDGAYHNREERLEIVGILLKHGADPNVVDCNGHVPLFWAFKKCNIACIKLLIEHGAKPEQVVIEKCLSFFIESVLASNTQWIEIIGFLKKHGAK